MNRRQKQKVSDLIKKLRINYNKLLIKKREMGNAEKHVLVDESIELTNGDADEGSPKKAGSQSSGSGVAPKESKEKELDLPKVRLGKKTNFSDAHIVPPSPKKKK